jgi:hypothetical protein
MALSAYGGVAMAGGWLGVAPWPAEMLARHTDEAGQRRISLSHRLLESHDDYEVGGC